MTKYHAFALLPEEVSAIGEALHVLKNHHPEMSDFYDDIQDRLALPAPSIGDDLIEQLIIARVVSDALAAGYTIEVHSSDGVELESSKNRAEILDIIFDDVIDEDRWTLHMAKPGGPEGWVLFVLGNGCSVISDNASAIDEVLKGAEALADELEAT